MNPECTQGQHNWEFAGRGQRRCDTCGRFGFIAQIRTSYKTKQALAKFKSPADSQGVRYPFCKATDSDQPTLGTAPLNARSTPKAARSG